MGMLKQEDLKPAWDTYLDSDETDRQIGMHACMKSNNSIFYTQHLPWTDVEGTLSMA